MRTETYEVTAGHKYHVFCALGGNVYKSKDVAVAATGWLESDDAGEAYIINGKWFSELPVDRADADAWTAIFAELGCGVVATAAEPLEGTTVKVTLQAVEPGAAGNAITLEAEGAGARVSGETLEGGGTERERVLIGTTGLDEDSGCEKMVKFEAAAPWARLEVDVTSESAWVLCRDDSLPMVPRAVATEPGKFYHIYADDCIQVYYRNVRLMEHLYFGGVGVVQAPGNELTILASAATEVNMFVCPPADGLSLQHSAFTHYGSGNVF